MDLKREMYGIFLTQTAPFQHPGIMDEFRHFSTACGVG